MLKRHFLLERPLRHSVEEVSHPLRTTVKPDASNGVMEGSVAVKAVTALHLPACSRGPAAEGVSPIAALCRRSVAPASHDRMHASDSVAVKAVKAPIRALCRRNLTPASHDRVHASDSLAAKAVTALRLPAC